jgi:predicted DNA-binding transcriptional regulator AlpA
VTFRPNTLILFLIKGVEMRSQTNPPQPHPTARLISRAGLRSFVEISDMGLWRWIKRGAFPKPVYINGRRFWRADELEAWLAARTKERTAA